MKKVLVFLGVILITIAAFAAADRIIQTNKLIMRETGGANIISMIPPSLAADYTLTLPTTDGSSGELLSTDGSGVLSWTAALSNPMNSVADIIVGGAAGAATRFAAGASGTALTISGTTHSYQVPAKWGQAKYDDQAGHGSTATRIPYYTNATVNNGNGIFTVANDSTNGLKVTFHRPALVTAFISYYVGAAGEQLGIALNGGVTTNPFSQTNAARQCAVQNLVISGTGYSTGVSCQFPVTTNDIVFPNTTGTACGDANSCNFHLTAIALPPF